MTRERAYGSDTAFCAWMRNCPDLPSYSPDFGFTASDNDITVHRYLTSVDRVGTREVQGIMQIEIKTRQGKPSASQMDTLSKVNLFSGSKKIGGVQVTFFGVFVLVLSGTTPDDSEALWWGGIPKMTIITNASSLKWNRVDKSMLVKLLRFERHPRDLSEVAFRRRHKTSEIVIVETSPLGYQYERKITHRS